MFDKLVPYERDLFFLINDSHFDFGDDVMWLFSQRLIWIPYIIILTGIIIYKQKWQIWLAVLISIFILSVCCDQFSASVCKSYFARFRPTHYPGIEYYVRTLYGYTGGKHGFISAHATNSFGFATFTALLFRSKYYSIVIYIWALILIYSRVYLGVHFVSDVVAGAMVGALFGYTAYKLCHMFLNKRKLIVDKNQPVFSKKKTMIITTTLLSYMFIVILFSHFIVNYIFYP